MQGARRQDVARAMGGWGQAFDPPVLLACGQGHQGGPVPLGGAGIVADFALAGTSHPGVGRCVWIAPPFAGGGGARAAGHRRKVFRQAVKLRDDCLFAYQAVRHRQCSRTFRRGCRVRAPPSHPGKATRVRQKRLNGFLHGLRQSGRRGFAGRAPSRGQVPCHGIARQGRRRNPSRRCPLPAVPGRPQGHPPSLAQRPLSPHRERDCAF